MSVLIVNYGMGNLASARRAFEVCGASVDVDELPESIHKAERIVIPGVGAFAAAMRSLHDRGWVDPIRQAAQEGIPVLGICLGMHLLADSGEEGGTTPGLGLIGGRVVRMQATQGPERIPHYGWNEINPVLATPLLKGIPPQADFFFAHSYHFIPANPDVVLAKTPYCGTLVSAVGIGRVFGIQFHPEKSSHFGLQLIRNFLES